MDLDSPLRDLWTTDAEWPVLAAAAIDDAEKAGAPEGKVAAWRRRWSFIHQQSQGQSTGGRGTGFDAPGQFAELWREVTAYNTGEDPGRVGTDVAEVTQPVADAAQDVKDAVERAPAAIPWWGWVAGALAATVAVAYVVRAFR